MNGIVVPPTLRRFQKDDSFVRFIVGPVGSGKSSVSVVEILYRACRQAPGPDGVARTRFAIIRNTYGQLRDTTRKTFEQWVPAQLGTFNEQAFSWTGRWQDEQGVRFECEVLFRALDRPEDVKKLLSLELTGAYINEAREVPKHVLDVLETRVGRFPSKAQGGATWFGIWADTNPWHSGHWGAKLFARGLQGYACFRQPGGRSPEAENVENLPPGYYERLCQGKDREWVRVYVDGEDADSDTGSVFGAWVADVDRKGNLCAFDHPKDRVFTAWDLGRSDSTAIWFWRYNASGSVDVIDHYEASGQGLSHYFRVLEQRGYEYARHWLPHDSRAQTLATQQTVLEQVAEWAGTNKVGVVPGAGISDGISAVRWLLEQQTRIHERCDEPPPDREYSGIESLREYRFKWLEDAQTFSKDPLHNFASHSADAFRYLALVVKLAPRVDPKHEPPGRENAPVPRLPTLDESWKAHDRARRR